VRTSADSFVASVWGPLQRQREAVRARCYREEMPQATYVITAQPPGGSTTESWDGMGTTAYDCDERVVVDPSWLTPTVSAIVQAIAEDGDFGRMPSWRCDARRGLRERRAADPLSGSRRHARGVGLSTSCSTAVAGG